MTAKHASFHPKMYCNRSLSSILNKRLVLLTLLLLCGWSGWAQTTRHQLHYTLRPTYPEKGSRLIVKLEMRPASGSSTRLLAPSVWGKNQTGRVFRSLRVKGATVTVSADSSELVLRHKPGQQLTLTYVFSDPNDMDSLFAGEHIYEPAIRRSFLSFFTNSVLFAVDDAQHPFTDCTLQVKAIESMFGPVTSSFGKPDKQGLIYLSNVRNEEVQNGILVAGDYRVHPFVSATGQTVTLAIRGNWSFSDQELTQLIKTTVDQQRTFWNDFSQPTFLVTVSPVAADHPNSLSYTGTGLANSFAVNATNGPLTTVNSLAYLFHHELMHHWIGGTILNAADEALSYWFSEGFTDYFTRVNMLESGVIDTAGYYQLIDSVFRSHYADKRMNFHNDSIPVHFWNDSYLGKLPYNRGSLFALLIDAQLRKATGGAASLKTVMQRLLVTAKAEASGAKPFHRTWLEAEVQAVAGLDIQPWTDRFIIAGEPIPIELFNAVLPQQLTEKRVKVFGFGMTLEKDATGKMKILEIKPDTGAAEATFRIGDVVLGYDVYMQPDSDSRLLVKREGKEIWVDFHPFEWTTVPQFSR